MATDEEVERKVDAEAEGDQMVRGEDAEWSTDEPERIHKGLGSSAVGDLLTGLSVGWTTVAPLSLAVLLFGGLLSVAVGATLWVSRYGFEATLTFAGVWAVVVAYVLAQVYARRGWI